MIKKIFNYLFDLLFLLLTVYIVLIHACPEKVKEFTGYQTFVILTDSMEPVIPTGSCVLVKNLKEKEEPEANDIVSFRVDRLGEQTVFTHYFREKETDEDGRVLYHTQGVTADRYEDYKIYREDLIGTYVWHVPYVGKVMLFLRSPFALIELGIIMLILIINRLLSNKFTREEEALAEAGVPEKGEALESKAAATRDSLIAKELPKDGRS